MSDNIKTQDFIKKAKEIHGDKYDYSLVDYTNCDTNIIIICKIHGQFKKQPRQHLSKSGCIKCLSDSKRKPINDFIIKANKIHNNKYDYSLVVYKDAKTKIIIICPIHGQFEQRADIHQSGSECQECAKETVRNKMRNEHDNIIIRLKEKYGNIHDYSLVNYIDMRHTIKIICQEHGVFEQRPDLYLDGHGCQKCASKPYSKKQITWLEYIAKRDNIYIQHAINDGEFKVGRYRVDGYCKETNTCYEFHGDLWHGNPKLYKPSNVNPINKITFSELYIKTLEKQLFIENQGYNLITIWENEWDTFIKNNKID